MNSKKPGCMRRIARALAGAVVVCLVIIACLLIYAWKVEPNWIEVTKSDVRFEEYPADAPPLKIVLIADIHFGPHNKEAFVRRVVKMINGLDPDVVLLAGDFTGQRGYAAQCGRALRGIVAKKGKYAVYGGHDYQQGADKIKRALRLDGIRMLKNENVKLGANTWLIGIDEIQFGKPDVTAAFRGVPAGAVRIVVTHDPRMFPKIRNLDCLTLVGHTHAGQMDFPGIPRNQLPGLLNSEYIRGWYHDGNSRMYVNRGIGSVIPYMRFRARPEISVIMISRGKPDYEGMKQKDPIDRKGVLRRMAMQGMRVLRPIYLMVRKRDN